MTRTGAWLTCRHTKMESKMSEEMTVAQALRRVKKLKGLVAEHTARARSGVSYVATEVPAFRFAEEVTALVAATQEMIDLESRIAVANSTATVKDGAQEVSLAKAIRTLQELKGLIDFYKGLSLSSGVEKVRTSDWDDDLGKTISRVEEITRVTDLSEKDRDQVVKAMQDRFEILNNEVEDANHKVLV